MFFQPGQPSGEGTRVKYVLFTRISSLPCCARLIALMAPHFYSSLSFQNWSFYHKSRVHSIHYMTHLNQYDQVEGMVCHSEGSTQRSTCFFLLTCTSKAMPRLVCERMNERHSEQNSHPTEAVLYRPTAKQPQTGDQAQVRSAKLPN